MWTASSVRSSRVKGSAKNIFLADFVRPEDVILSETVKEFYRENGNLIKKDDFTIIKKKVWRVLLWKS